MKRTIISLFLTVILLFVLPLQAGVNAYADSQKPGSIQIVMKNSEGKAIEGAKITLYQIADLDENNGQAVFIPTAEFSSSGIPLPVDMTADVNIQTATDLIEYITSSKITADSALVNKDGIATFTGLNPGLYLIRQTGSAEGYKDIISFLVSLPITDANGQTADYDLTVVPKVIESSNPPVTPTPNPSATPTPNPSATPTPNPSATPTPDPSATPTPDPSATPTPDPSATLTPDPSTTPAPSDRSGDGSDGTFDKKTGVLPATRLPQTGMLLWPIVLLAVVGMLLISIGWADANLRRKDK